MDKTFIKITNSDIFLELKQMHQDLNDFKYENEKQHDKINEQHQINKGRISVIGWLAGAGLSVACFAIVCLFAIKS